MVLIYTDLIHAQALCYRLSPCKGSKDQDYSIPIENKTSDKYAVQVLDQHHSELTETEQSNLVELPADWFDLLI